jgi:hypothetical protein
VSAFGRYAVTVTSSQGVALQSVDRMAGAGSINGEVGNQDGRLDMFLDRGQYKILTHASPEGKGKATLAAYAFKELQPRAPLLVEYRLERGSLGDFEQRSYWIEIKQKRNVALEAAGRHLADLRLWRDGTWLVDAKPQITQVQAHTGQPLLITRLTTELTPGLYLLTAYGGPSQTWTEASEAKPFYLRYGIPTLASAMRQQFTMSEFGTDRFLVPAEPNYFRLELPSAEPATLQVGDHSDNNPFQTSGESATIDKKSLLPVAELNGVNSGNVKVVSVSMEAGKAYILQHFEQKQVYSPDLKGQSGDYWISSIHAGPLEDSVGATAVITRERSYRPEEYLDEKVVDFSKTASWHRRFNLLSELTLFVKIPEPTKVRLAGTGVKARYRFEPFVVSRPNNYATPAWRDSGYTFELDRGLYVLTIAPDTKGILDLQMNLTGGLANEVLSKIGMGNNNEPTTMSPAYPSVRFSPVKMETNTRYTVYLNNQPGVASGLIVRKLPIDLEMALPVVLRAGETLTVPVVVAERSTLQALSEDGRALEFALDNGKNGSSIDVEAGRYNVTVKGADKAQYFSLKAEPTRLASTTPLPPVPDTRLAALPKFPVITPDAPRYVALKKNSASVQGVRVEKSGFYQFESTGLLRTAGTVRTRINPSLFDGSENGVGRNFMIQRYLREGDYQLSVTTLGETTGDLGIQVARTEVQDGGELREGQVARAFLPNAQSIAYRFKITKRASYHLQTIGLGRNFDIRLEDDAGWPVAAPVMNGNQTLQLSPGNYRMIILPQTAEARVLSRLDRLPKPARYRGHGPHRIALESQIEHSWIEPAKGATRTPDQWEFVLPAPADVSIAMGSEMEATLVNTADPKRAAIAKFDATTPWSGQLVAGRYQIQARNSRSNNHVAYSLRVSAIQLLAGQSRSITAPTVIPLSVGSDGLVELQSFGATDVRARLLDSAGEVVAQNDDRADDWNFQIAQRLRPGEYKLQVDPVNEKSAVTTITMLAPKEITEKPLGLATDSDITDANVHIYPLVIPADRNIVLASAKSSDVVGLALEAEAASGWINLGSVMAKEPRLALPLAAGSDRFKTYRLRAWSVDRRSLRMRLRVVAAALPIATESQWQQGIAPSRMDESLPAVQLAMIALSRPGVFRIKGDLAPLKWSYSGARTAQGGSNAVVSIVGKNILMMSEERRQGESNVLAAERLRLPTGQLDTLRLELGNDNDGAIDMQAGLSLAIAQSRVGQPGIAIGETRDPRAMGLVPGEAVAVTLSATNTSATVWNATSIGTPFEMDLRQVPFQSGPTQSAGFGMSDGTVKSRIALPIKLPGSMQRIRLTLAPMNAAVLVKRGTILSTHWSGSDALHEEVATDADQLWLLNADATDAQYSVEVVPGAGEAEPALKPGDLLERNLSTVGRLRIPIDIPKSSSKDNAKDNDQYIIRVRGNVQAMWQENGGRIVTGNDIVIHNSGTLSLQHQAGTLIAWLDAPRTQSAKQVTEWFKSLQETSVKPPQVITLRNKQQVLSIKTDRATMLHVRTNVPVVTQFAAEGQAPVTDAHLYGANINMLAPAGTSRLMLRAVGADSLSGLATVMSTPITSMSEGSGPEVLLAPGSARLYTFEIKQQRPIGIGVRASSDVVRSVLYDERGAVQSEGVVQMPTLAPGRYYLSIEMPADSAPVKVRPIVLGLKEPDTRPPGDILRRYVESKDDSEALLYVPEQPAPPPAEEVDEEDKPQQRSEEEAAPKEEGQPEPETDKESN